ncbi:hypothetical protein PA25_22350 [Pseudoalteromonas sp. A25]|uniref:hypothetical protein n=1 Tax=Pseudoalteromonas sp. A25 TaxID=116092 RepID=UPI00126094A7|nr:hypothetical protein [Pseudoalteromonas sp. A25]BBN82250.1 hypothetical protein PA25_22350 [Pseudoalteromonas sp. A25]
MEVKSINLRSSTADCKEQPTVEWSNFDLSVRFKNWMNEDVQLNFFDVPHFKFLSSDESTVSNLSDDQVYEVQSSDLLENLIQCDEIAAEEGFKHWFIGFNEIGSFIEVVFRSFTEK